MRNTRWFFSIVAAFFIAAITIPAFAQSNPPKIEKVWSSLAKSSTVVLSMNYNAQGLPSRGWFEISTNANMSNAKNYSERQNQGYNGSSGFNSTISGLTPATTYYFRGVISSPAGKVESTIASFKTEAATAAQPPSISFDSSGYETYNGVLSYRCSFKADGKGLAGTLYLLWSTHADMSGAQRVGQQGLPASSVGQGFHPQINISKMADKTVIYYQGVVETSAGTVKTPVKSVEIRNAPY